MTQEEHNAHEERSGGEDSPKREAESLPLDTFVYDDAIVRKFVAATLIWGIVGMGVGVLIAIQLILPRFNFDTSWLSFGRLRPLHTNAVIFAFAGNAIFAGIYHSSQRLLKARMFSDRLSQIHFWGWQGIIVAAAITLPLGITQSREYAELEWPIDIAIAVIWVIFAINFFGTIRKRRERHLYVALWFYIATIITVAILHIFNNIWVIAGWWKSYSVYAGVQDAFMQWWYGHNAVAFFLTTPFLGLMYYYLPKASKRPVYSYRLSILHFWSLIFIYIWAGPHHLHYTALPAWASTLGMVFSVMLWMPSWGGMINGLLTLRGAWNKVAEDAILKFFVVGVTFYGMSTFEGPLLSIKSVNALAHYTDWIIAHVHSGTLGWNGFIIFGMIYWLVPRLFQTEIWSKKLVGVHFWMGTIGILLYVISLYVAGITQGLMWRAFDGSTGQLQYPEFIRTVEQIIPMYWVRAVGGTLYLLSVILGSWNILMTWRNRPKVYEEVEQKAVPLDAIPFQDVPPPPTSIDDLAIARKLADLRAMHWHRVWERLPLRFTVWVVIAVSVASLFEIVPTFLIRSNVPTIQAVKPYKPLELAGRDIYVREGCYNCHSQMVRPLREDTERYKNDPRKPGIYSKPGEFVYDHPFQWGSRRIGPDLHRVGGKYNHRWHFRHMKNPRGVVKLSRMPSYPWLFTNKLPGKRVERAVKAMSQLGVPYTAEEVKNARKLAEKQALKISLELANQQRLKGPALEKAVRRYKNKEIIALIAYLQRLGTDVVKHRKK